MAAALKIPQLLERDGMAEVEVGRGRIHPELDAQRAALAEPGRKLIIRDDLCGVTPQFPRLLFCFVLFQLSRNSPATLPQRSRTLRPPSNVQNSGQGAKA